MAQEVVGSDWVDEPFEFEIGETVKLLWSGDFATVTGKMRCMHQDDQFLISYVDNRGMLVSHLVYGDVIDHQTAH